MHELPLVAPGGMSEILFYIFCIFSSILASYTARKTENKCFKNTEIMDPNGNYYEEKCRREERERIILSGHVENKVDDSESRTSEAPVKCVLNL